MSTRSSSSNDREDDDDRDHHALSEDNDDGGDDEADEADSTIDSLIREAGHIPKISAAKGDEDEPDRIGAQLGRFRIEAELGKGGMGIVYRARDLELGRHVALKVLPRAAVSDDERRRRFLREAKAAAAVSHPNLAAVFDVGEAEGTVFLAMELVRGPSLRTKMDQNRAAPKDPVPIRRAPPRGMPVADAIAIAIQIAHGVGKAHASGIVHRDLKPENVMMDDEAGGAAKVVDFGLAKLVMTPERAGGGGGSAGGGANEGDDTSNSTNMSTLEGKILGTPSYMAPEQAKASRVSPAADVFSIGVVLYEMLTGARPFTGTTLVDVLVSVAHDTPQPPSKRAPGARISRELDRIVLRCLAKDQTSRYPDANALASALEQAPLHKRARPSGGALALIVVAAAALLFGIVTIANLREKPTTAREHAPVTPEPMASSSVPSTTKATTLRTSSSASSDFQIAAEPSALSPSSSSPRAAMSAPSESAKPDTARPSSLSVARAPATTSPSHTPSASAVRALPSATASAVVAAPPIDPLARQK